MIAIPVLRSRVAPVLNWCSTLWIVPRNADATQQGLQLRFESADPFDLLRMLKAKAVSTLICGALTSDLLAFGEQLGFRIIHGVAGEVEEVIEAYRQDQLDQPRFRLPGCDGAYRHRRGTQEGCCGTGEKSPSIFSGACVCSRCGAELPHERGIPCSQVVCPACEGPMIRKKNSRPADSRP